MKKLNPGYFARKIRAILLAAAANESLFFFAAFISYAILGSELFTWHQEATQMFERFIVVPWGMALCLLRLDRKSRQMDAPWRLDLSVLFVLVMWVIVPFGIRFGLTFNNVTSWQSHCAAYFALYAMLSEEKASVREQRFDLAGALMGLLFAVMGNYMPKTRMNSTIGIKVYWAYTSQENWNATHRFGGKVWVIGGICMMFAALLPEKWSITVMIVSIFVLAFIPILYSYLYYRGQVQRGEPLDLSKPAFSKTDKRIAKFSAVYVAAILAFVLVLMFTGSIDVHMEEDAMRIEASWYTDLTVKYDIIDSIEYREGNVDGTRVGGWGSAKLLLGFFRNEEFGTHTRYTVTNPDACIVIYTERDVLVLSGDTLEETQFIYDSLMAKIG